MSIAGCRSESSSYRGRESTVVLSQLKEAKFANLVVPPSHDRILCNEPFKERISRRLPMALPKPTPRAKSYAVAPIGPYTPTEGAKGKPPNPLTRPCVGFNPNTPLYADGMRILPPPSVPITAFSLSFVTKVNERCNYKDYLHQQPKDKTQPPH